MRSEVAFGAYRLPGSSGSRPGTLRPCRNDGQIAGELPNR